MASNGLVVASRSEILPRGVQLSGLASAAAALGLGLAVAGLPLEAAAIVAPSVIVLVLAFVEPAAALAGLLLVLPVSTLLSFETGDFAITATEPLMALLVVSWLARGLARRDLPIAGGWLVVPLTLVLVAMLVSSIVAERLGLAAKELIKWFELMTVFLFSATHVRQLQATSALLAILLVAGTAEAIYGIFQYATGQGPTAFTIGEALRAFGHFEQPNPFAGYLGTILPLAIVLAARGRTVGLRVLAAFAAVSIGVGIYLSLSRGAWLGVMLGLVAMMAAWSPASRRWLVPVLGTLGVILLLAAGNALPGGWTERLAAVTENFGIFDVRTVEVTSENVAVVERMAHWQAGWYMLQDHPLLGVGTGNYQVAYEEYFLPGWREALGHAHNYYLNMAAECGLLGAGALLLLMAGIFGEILGGLRRQPPGSYRRALLVGLLGSFVVLTVHNTFDNLLVHGMPVQVGFLLGLVVALNSTRAAADQANPAVQGARSGGA